MTTLTGPSRPHAAAVAIASPRAWETIVLRAVLFVVLILGAGGLLAASLAPIARYAATGFAAIDDQLLDYPPLPETLGELPERSVIVARDGSVLATLHDAENRDIVSLDEVPEHVRNAVLATEDASFYEHRGVNWRSVGRAAVGNAAAGEVTSGASTITQQLVKLNVVGDDVTLDRKLREAVYAIQLEERMTKDEILEAYLNEAYFGQGAYGIAAAAEHYWGTRPADLTVDEAAVLAGVIRAPSRNDPVRQPANALARRNVVLGQMVLAGFLDGATAAELRARPLELDVNPLAEPTQPFFVDYVRQLLMQEPALGPDERTRDLAVLRGGLTIHTTLDPRLQEIAREVIATTLDSPADPLAALTSVDPRTGEILAVAVGPREYGSGEGQLQVNPAVAGLGGSGRQPGSSFKTFQIVASLEDGVSPAYTIDTPSPYRPTESCTGSGWTPGNYRDSGGGVMDMADATARSSNVYFAHLTDLQGPDAMVDVARRMGVRSTELQSGICATVLGSQEVFPLDMAAAYGTLANDGEHCPPYAIAQIVDRDGAVLAGQRPSCERAIDTGVARRTTELLRGPLERGTATRHGQLGRPAAGKTGTTDANRDAWFVGYVPQLSTAAWVGHEQQRTMTDSRCGGGVTGGCLPTMIWQQFMARAVEVLDLPPQDFAAPPPLPKALVPGVVGLPEATAMRRVRDAGFRPVVDVGTSHQRAGTVVAQRPGAGTRVELGSRVTVVVSDGRGQPPVVPSLVGLSADEARARLRALGVDAAVRESLVDDPAAAGRVVAQRPSAGSPLPAGGVVTIEVGRLRDVLDNLPAPGDLDGDGIPDEQQRDAPVDDGVPDEEPVTASGRTPGTEPPEPPEPAAGPEDEEPDEEPEEEPEDGAPADVQPRDAKPDPGERGGDDRVPG